MTSKHSDGHWRLRKRECNDGLVMKGLYNAATGWFFQAISVRWVAGNFHSLQRVVLT